MQLHWTNRLSYKLARTGVIIAFLLGIVLSLGQIYLDYLDEEEQFDGAVNRSLDVAMKAATRAVHIIDEQLAEEVVSGLLEYDYIIQARIVDETGSAMATSEQKTIKVDTIYKRISNKFSSKAVHYERPLYLRQPNADQSGQLQVVVDKAVGLQSFFERSVTTFFSVLIRNMILVGLLYVVFYFQLTRPLTNLTTKLANIEPGEPGSKRVALPPGHENDELGILVNGFNLALDTTRSSVENLQFTNKALEASEDALRRRTWELEQEVERTTQGSKELLRTKEQAEAANRAKSVFLANVSHELRTPLNAIIGFSSVMADEVFGPIENSKYKEYLDDIRTSSQHLSELLGEVLDLAKVEADEVNIENEDVNITDLCNESKSLMSGQATQKNLKFVMEIEENMPMIKGDRLRLKQAVLNLLSNAIKFTPAGEGKVSLVAKRSPEGGVVISVSDTGIGIPDGEQELVFSPFIRSSSAHSRSHEGTGLGLSLVSTFVAKHDGTIEVNSVESIGTTITIKFPKSRVI